MKAIVKNLRDIRDYGVEQWLGTQETKWQCPNCKAHFSWYTPECRRCGKELTGIKDYETLSEEDNTF